MKDFRVIRLWSFLVFLCMGWVWHAQALADSTMTVLFETQWHQSGVPVNASQWVFKSERQLSYAIKGESTAHSRGEIQKALTAVSREAQIEFVPTTDPQQTAQIVFEVSPVMSGKLSQASAPCLTQYPARNGFQLQQVLISIYEHQAYRCSLHELMHGMGLQGHPSGDTVLSYFEGNRSGLKEIDKFLLKHWNSDLITPGMNIFRVTELLGHKWLEEKVPPEQQDQVRQEQRQWFVKTMAQMDAFADGKGDVPSILHRSGRLSDEGVKRSLLVVQGILGVAHLEGYGTPRNLARARDLLFRGTKNQTVGARNALLRAMTQDKFQGESMAEVCDWFKATPIADSKLTQAQLDEVLKSKACGAS